MLEHIRDENTPKEAWDMFVTLFSKKNETRLQLLENELLAISQRDMTIAQYFHKVKLICREITELDPQSVIAEARMKRIIIHGLRPEYRSFVTAVQGWPVQPSLVEFENLLASQEAMVKQIGGITLKSEEEALYTSKSRRNFKPPSKEGYKNADKGKRCSNHMTGDQNKVQDVKEYKGSRMVLTANNARLPVAQTGKTKIMPGNKSDMVSLHNVYHVPAESAYVEKTRKNETSDLWHARLGHVGYHKLKLIMEKSILKGLPQLKVKTNIICAGCQYGKAHKLPYKESNFRAKKPLELIHSDVFGPVKQTSVSGMRYMVTFIDDYSRYVWVFFMKEKSETFSKFLEFKTTVKGEVRKKIRCLRSDNG
uniref:Integrase catalytic domain-containing protein n=1 Tax=Lactuca sativa TaxID=4236 RepID=A0A9R1VID6_LACSA|nr:hypothetical protein LSAT_V11C500244610 [Lactuca sativa]